MSTIQQFVRQQWRVLALAASASLVAFTTTLFSEHPVKSSQSTPIALALKQY
jgi:hypothetical protein